MEYRKIIVDVPRPKVQRITLNRPDKRNPLSNELRGELFHALESADNDANIAVTVIRGAGECFSAGYDLKSNVARGQPFHTAGGLGNWPRHVVDGFFRMWDLGEACHRAGARLLPRRRHRTRDRVRSGLRGRRREDRLSGRARDQPAGQSVLSVDRRPAAGDGTDADRRLDVGRRRGRVRLREPRFSERGTRRRACSISPNALPKCHPTSSRSTSARCIGRWTRWVFARVFVPEPKCRRSRRSRAQRRRISPNCAMASPTR